MTEIFNKQTLVFLFFAFLCFNASPQDSNIGLLRIEFETKQEVQPYKILPFNENGVLVFFESVKESEIRGHSIWVFQLFDVNLGRLWTQELDIINGLRFKSSTIENDIIYLLFSNEEKKIEGNNIQIVSVPALNGVIRAKALGIPPKSLINHFVVIQNKAVLSYFDQDQNSFLFITSLTDSLKIIYPVSETMKTSIWDVKTDKDKKSIILLLKEYNKKSEAVYLKKFNLFAELESSLLLFGESEEFSLNNGQFLCGPSGEELVAGLYRNTRNNNSPKGKNDYIIESSGIFVATINDNNNNVNLSFYNFSEFRNFYKNLSVNDISQLRKSAKKNENVSVDYNLLPHKIIPLDSSIVFVAEAYYPEYHTVTQMMYDWYGRPMPSYYQVFDGYRYTSAFISGISYEGELLWDNGISIWDILSQKLENRVNLIFDNKDIIVAFTNNGEIIYHIISENQLIEDKDFVTLDLLHSKDRVFSEEFSNMAYWYKNYFLVYGYQTIKNNGLPNNKRSVFFINKIAFK